jgi:cytoskeleton-associated protein 5
MQLPHDSTALDEIGPPPSSNGEEIIITLEGLDESLKSSNWQMRKAAYVFLNERMRALSIDTVPSNLLSTISVYDSLDQAIIKALNDKNAGALDAALTLSITYAETCQDASSDDAISQIMKSLLKGPAFLSARSSTLASTEELVLKLIEISRDGSSSIQDIFDLIQLHGLKSVKPKVVIFSAKLILKAVQSFGASVLPIQALKASSESLVAHSNAQAREIGMQLLAEICRALGSKGPLQILIEKLKTAQQSQLDSLLMDMSTSVPSRRLRRNIGQPVSSCSPDEVLAALKKSQEEDELRRLASRPAVNLFHVLSQTCYKEKIKLEKWSEKVAALDALIGAGGEQPFKLCQPSSSIDYTELISELKKLLSHTHFAVCSKSLAAFGMLAEGVGEKMFHHLRFLIPTFVSLFKDKKVVNAVGSCLDKMFANVFSFEHLLDSKDSLPSSIDEKKQKNALVRRHCLEYLNRCIQSSGTYGTRGEITIQYANDISKLACASLADSDVATRKASTDVLLALVNNNDEAIATAAKKTVSSLLQTTNPRALKSLMSSSNISEETTARPRNAPNSLSTKLASKEGTSEPSKQVVAKEKIKDPSRATSGHSISTASADEGPLPTFDDSVDYLSALCIPKWDDDVDNEGVLAGIQCES